MTEVVRSSSMELAAPLTGGLPGMKGLAGKAGQLSLVGRQVLAQPAVKRSLPLLGMLGVGALALIAFLLFRDPGYQPLFSNLGDSDKAAIAEALQAGNFDFKIDETTGSLLVPAKDYHKARMLLASQGLPNAVPSGYDLLGNMPLGTSRAVERARLKQSEESELTRSIMEIAGVEAARVHLALPETSVFVRDRTAPSASVFVKLAPGRALGEAQVRSIMHLVASSVPGLAAENVAVVDQNGTLLTPDMDGSELGESTRQLSFQERMERMYRERLQSLLTPMLGPDSFTAEVHLDLDFTRTEQTQERYDRENAALRSEQESRSSEGGLAPRGIPGAISNEVPPVPQIENKPPEAAPGAAAGAPAAVAANGAGLGATGGPSQESFTRNYEVGRAISVTKPSVGSIRRMTAAVVIRDPGLATGKPTISQKDLQAIEQLVRGTIGFDAQRGDLVTVTNRSFAPALGLEELSWWQAAWFMDIVKNVTLLLGLIIVVFGLRPLLKRKAKVEPVVAELPAPDNQGNLPVAIAGEAGQAGELAGGEADPDASLDDELGGLRPKRSSISDAMLQSANSYDDKVALIRMFVAEDAARATNVLRQLMNAELHQVETKGE